MTKLMNILKRVRKLVNDSLGSRGENRTGNNNFRKKNLMSHQPSMYFSLFILVLDSEFNHIAVFKFY